MADQIRGHASFPGTNFTDYRITVSYNNGYGIAWSRVNGSPPSVTDSGEIIVELDWSQLSGDVFDPYTSTSEVAWPVTWALMQTNLIPELDGHALVEGPIHLIGHSRGGSLMSEVGRLLGTNSITKASFLQAGRRSLHTSPIILMESRAEQTNLKYYTKARSTGTILGQILGGPF